MIPIVPRPKQIEESKDRFDIQKEMTYNSACFDSKLIENLQEIMQTSLKKEDVQEATIQLVYEKTKKEEEYELTITNKNIRIEASSDIGIYYGLQTLRQCKRQNSFLGCKIQDHPDLPVRGVMIDISRSKVPTLETLKQIVTLCSQLKYNHIELYVEGFSYEYESFPEVLSEKNYIRKVDYVALEQYAKEHYMDLVPNQNGFGHMSDWLARDEYHHLAECEDGFTIWGCHRPSSTLDPTNKESYELVKKMYEDMLPCFTSPYFNMNFDEPYELGHGKSKEECEKTSKEDVFLSFFRPLYEVVKQYHKTPLIWGDCLIHHPEAIAKLPKDMILIDWGYSLGYDFKTHAKMLKEHKVNFILAPGTCTWSTVTGRYDDMIGSIQNSSKAAKENGGLGILVTDWGDIGHLQYLPFSYPGFIYGAQCGWDIEDESVIQPYLEKLVGVQCANAILLLSKYTNLEGSYRDYGSRLFSVILWAEHARRQTNPVEFYLDKMQWNGIEEKQRKELRLYFENIAKIIQKEESIVKKEIQNSIELLVTLLDIQEKLELVIQQKNQVNFEKEILILEAYKKEHHVLWNLRNIEAGFIPSSNRIQWLIQMLTKIDERR